MTQDGGLELLSDQEPRQQGLLLLDIEPELLQACPLTAATPRLRSSSIDRLRETRTIATFLSSANKLCEGNLESLLIAPPRQGQEGDRTAVLPALPSVHLHRVHDEKSADEGLHLQSRTVVEKLPQALSSPFIRATADVRDLDQSLDPPARRLHLWLSPRRAHLPVGIAALLLRRLTTKGWTPGSTKKPSD